MSSYAISSGAVTVDTQLKALGTRGAVTYAEAIGDTLIAYDGDATGIKLFELASGDRVSFDPPVRYANGLYLNVGVAGPVVVHIA